MKAIITVDLGFGDAGKGRVVDALVRKHGSDLIVRYNGGCQCAHNVVLPNGKHHTFSQFGSGMFNPGTRTLLGKHVMVSPTQMLTEAEVLRRKGYLGFMDRTYVDGRCLITTPFHRAVNRLKELGRGNARHGSCGSGIGETRSFELHHPDLALRAYDLAGPNLNAFEQKLWHMRQIMAKHAQASTEHLELAIPEHRILTDPDVFDAILERYSMFANMVHIVDPTEAYQMLRKAAMPIFEGAQGLLLDETYGFTPYNTWTNTTAKNALQMMYDAGATTAEAKDCLVLGITRTYMTRHGPGPFVTETKALNRILCDTYNDSNPWQREFRFGWFDAMMLRYALQMQHIDAVAVTHTDQLDLRATWQMCTRYINDSGVTHMPNVGDVGLTQRLFDSVPEYACIEHDEVLSRIVHHAGVPLMLTTHGAVAGQETWH